MSRTFRRKRGDTTAEQWYLSEWVRSIHGYILYREPLAKDSTEYKNGYAKYHGDRGSHNCKEPGPGWFRRLFNTKPSRAGARNEITKWLRNEEYEVVAETHPHLPYWT